MESRLAVVLTLLCVACAPGTGEPVLDAAPGGDSGTRPEPRLDAAVDAPPASGTVFFFEPFDDADYASRGWYDNGDPPVSTAEHVPGSVASLEMRMPPGAQQAIGGAPGRHRFGPTDEVYVSYWVKYSANWVGSQRYSHPHEIFFMTTLDGEYVGPYSAAITTYVEHTHDGSTGMAPRLLARNRDSTDDMIGPVRFMDAPGPGHKNEWHFVEAYFRMNSAPGIPDGAAQYWFDGELVIDRDDLVIRRQPGDASAQFSQVLIAPFIGVGSPVDQTVWFDDVTVASSRP
jgi:hypothetical protein